MNGAALVQALIDCKGSVTATADRHGLSRDTVYSRLAAFGLGRPGVQAIRKHVRRGDPLPPEVERLRVYQAPAVGDAILGPVGVTLSLPDYAILLDQAKVGVGAAGLVDDIAESERIITTLADKIEVMAQGGHMTAYTYQQLGELKSQILDICERVRADNPTAWREAHNGNFDDTSTRYNDLCVQALRAAGIFAGCNGKRGGDQRSDDVLVFGLRDTGGARDASGRFASIAIIDYIGGAGGPNPSVGWNDVSAASPGRFLDPQGLASVDGAAGPVTPPSPVTPSPVIPPMPQPPVGSEALQVIRAQLDVLIELQRSMMATSAQAATRADMDASVAGVYQLIAEQVIGVHLDDIKDRIDRGGGAGSGVGRCNFPRLRGSLMDEGPERPEPQS